MFYAKKLCVFEILSRLGYKGCLLRSSLPAVRILEELSATVTTCVKKYACDIYFSWHEAFVSLHKS